MNASRPGWYPDAYDARYERYFDGRAWTTAVRPRSPQPAPAPAPRRTRMSANAIGATFVAVVAVLGLAVTGAILLIGSTRAPATATTPPPAVPGPAAPATPSAPDPATTTADLLSAPVVGFGFDCRPIGTAGSYRCVSDDGEVTVDDRGGVTGHLRSGLADLLQEKGYCTVESASPTHPGHLVVTSAR